MTLDDEELVNNFFLTWTCDTKARLNKLCLEMLILWIKEDTADDKPFNDKFFLPECKKSLYSILLLVDIKFLYIFLLVGYY